MTTVLRSHSELETLPGGKYRLTQHLKPIAYDHGGAWTRITNVLGNSGDPNFPIGTDELLQFRIRDRLAGQSPMFHFGKGNHSLRATLLDTNNTDGIVNGAAILFPNAWNNADFELILAGHKIKGNVYLRSGHPQTYRLRIDESTGFDPATLMLGDVARILPPVLLPPASNPAAQIPLSWAITQQGGKWILAVTLPQGDYAGWVLDPTLTLQPDAADGKDTGVWDDAPTFNFGARSEIPISARRGLIEFDISSIPPGAVCNSGTLFLYLNWPGTITMTLYSIASGNSAWIEGTKDYTVAGSGEPCWNALAADGSGGVTTAWAGSVGLGTINTDYEAAALGSFATNNSDPIGTEYPVVLTATRVQGWFGIVNTNYGLLLARTGGTDGPAFRSSDHTTAANRPKLVVEYMLPKTFARAPMWGRF